MNECIIYYDGLSHYNDPAFVNKRTLKTICVPKENILRYRYHRNTRCSKLTEHIRQKKSDSIENSFQNSNSVNEKIKSASTRTTTKEVTNGLSPVKRAKRKRFSSSLEKNVMEKRLQSFLPVLQTSSVSLSLLGSLAPTNSFVSARMWVIQDS